MLNSYPVTVGRLLRKCFKNLLDKMIYLNYDIKYKEFKSFLQSEFIIKCSCDDFNIIRQSMKDFE
jgi:hypothetical protein